MAKISVRAASMQFDVSRPTITKWIKSGKISAERLPSEQGGGWILDSAELVRLGVPGKPDKDVSEGAARVALAADNNDLQAEVDRLHRAVAEAEVRAAKAEMAAQVSEAHREAAERVAAERCSLIEAYQRMLPDPNKEAAQEKPRRRWWPWGGFS